MARQASPTSNVTPADLRATKGALDQRWLELSRLFATTLGFEANGRQLRVDVEYQAERAWAGLTGAACERVMRNHGGTTWVVPLCRMPSELLAWLGWQEVWVLKTGPKPFQFRSIGLTVYIGRPNEGLKPQFLRLEWPGISDWSRSTLSFQSPGAGHPHWQLDLLQSLRDSTEVLAFDPDPHEIVEDFEVTVATRSVDNLVRALSFERMHLASAAPWWLAAANEFGNHMNAPSDLAALSRWLECSIRYLRQELARCVLRL
jgi:hypothetical protein